MNTVTKIIGGVVFVTTVTLGAAACGSSSHFSVESHPGDPNKIHTVGQFKSEQYWTVQNQVVVTAMQNNSLMAFGASIPADEGAVTDALLADTHNSAMITDVVTQIANGCRTNDLSNIAYSNYLNATTAATCPTEVPNAPSPTPAAAPAPAASAAAASTPAPAAQAPAVDATATALAKAMNGQGPGTGATVSNYAISSDGSYAAAIVKNTSTGEYGTAWYSLANGTWTETVVNENTYGMTAQLAKMPVSDFNEVTNAVEHTNGIDYNAAGSATN